jgi:peptidoglycan/LPS O-acetylase OafA/YrhL
VSAAAPNGGGADGGRLVQLDALRGIAAMSVVLFHYTSGLPRAVPVHSAPLVVFPSGSVGVQMFFAISGFVIFMTLEHTRGIARFAQARFARLYPTYIACVCITLLAIGITGINYRHIGLLTILSAPLMATGVVNGLYVDSSYWTLTLEVCFYAWAGVAYFQGGARGLLFAVALWVPVCTILRVLGLPELYPRISALLLAEHFHWFAIGIALYCLFQRRHIATAWAILGLAILSAAVVSSAGSPEVALQAKEIFKAVLLAVLVYAAARGALRVLDFGPLLFLGAISYALFLVHQVLGFNLLIVMDGAGIPLNVGIPIVLGISILVAAAIRRFVELPAYRAIRPGRPVAVAAAQ